MVLHRQSSSVLQINYKGTQTRYGCAKPALSSQDYRFRHTPHLVPKPAQVEKLHRSGSFFCQAKKPMTTDGACKALKSCTAEMLSWLYPKPCLQPQVNLKMPTSDVATTYAHYFNRVAKLRSQVELGETPL